MRRNNSSPEMMDYDSFDTGINNSFLIFLVGLGTGAALMYFLDPDRGRRRRALMRDQAVALTNDVRETINETTEDLSNRAYGLYAETRKAVTGSPVPSDRENQSNADQSNTTGENTEIRRSATQR